jgi:alkylation response protein AidB-like acyl-CoA dehydrogenase
MSSQPTTQSHSDTDSSPLLLPAKVLRSDAGGPAGRPRTGRSGPPQAASRDQQRKLPWAEIEQFTRSGLGSISIPKAYGGPEVSFVTIAEVFRLISAADPALGQIPQNQFGILQLVRLTATEAQKQRIFRACSTAGASAMPARSAAPRTP